MTVLDFGAGSCWTSHFLTQMGCRVVAMDISEAMIDLGRRRYKEHPVFGSQPAPEFNVFDGHRMDLDDGSVDRVLCFDALHHVANMREVLSEMGRVLRPGGLAGFSEPGPSHSKDAQSQHEMRRYGVPERDLVLEDVWGWAAKRVSRTFRSRCSPRRLNGSRCRYSTSSWRRLLTLMHRSIVERLPRLPRASAVAGFGRSARGVMLLSIGRSCRCSALSGSRSELNSPRSAKAAMAHVANVRTQLFNRRMFIIRKEGEELPDSREATGLQASSSWSTAWTWRPDHTNTRVTAVCTITNTGRNRWLPSSVGNRGGASRAATAPRQAPERRPRQGGCSRVTGCFAPGESVVVELDTEVDTPWPAKRSVWLELDLVSEGISWFAEVHGHPIEIAIPPYASN